MFVERIIYLAIGIILILAGATIKIIERRKVIDDGWSHPVATGCIIIGLATTLRSFVFME